MQLIYFPYGIYIILIATTFSQIMFLEGLPQFLSAHQYIQSPSSRKWMTDFLELDRVDSNSMVAGIQTQVI